MARSSMQSRVIEWVLRLIRVKKMFSDTHNLREKVFKRRPTNPAPPRSMYRRYRVEESSQGGRRMFTLRRRDGTGDKSILYLHGGAYVYEMMGAQWKMLGKILDRSDVTITVPLFPLAPENTVEDALPFVVQSYENLLRRTPNGISLIGDSSGGGMAVALFQILREARRLLPERLVLLSPWLDVTCSDSRQLDLDKADPILAPKGLIEEGGWYAGRLSPEHPTVSPLFGSVEGMPPTLVLTGTHDLLHADSLRLQSIGAGMNLPLRVSTYQNMMHVWPSMPIPEAERALDEVASFLSETLTVVEPSASL